MNTYIERDDRARKAAVAMKWIYVLSGVLIAIAGAMAGNISLLHGACFPAGGSALAGIYRFFRLKPGWRLRYGFMYLHIRHYVRRLCGSHQKIHGFDRSPICYPEHSPLYWHLRYIYI